MGRSGYDTTNMKVAKNPRPAAASTKPEPKTGENGDNLETTKQAHQQQHQEQEQPQGEPLTQQMTCQAKMKRTFNIRGVGVGSATNKEAFGSEVQKPVLNMTDMANSLHLRIPNLQYLTTA